MAHCSQCRGRRLLVALSAAEGLLCACCCLALAVCDAWAAQRATACMNQQPQLQCSYGERISIRKLLHSYDPRPCLDPHPDNNCTVEDSDHLKEVVSDCNGRISCSPYTLRDVDGGPKAPEWCRINNAVYFTREAKFNYMDVTYDCKSDTFCTELSRNGPGRALIRTPSYPAPTAPTSSSCECQFSINHREAQKLIAHVTCPNSTVRFRYESVSQQSETSLKESDEVLCKGIGDGSPLLLASVQAHHSLTVSVIEDGSDERSAYGVSVAAFRHSAVVDNSLAVSVTCKGSAVIFTRTEKIIIGVTIPCLVIIIILLVIAAKIVYVRRKRRQPLSASPVELPPLERSCGDGSAPSDHSYSVRTQDASAAAVTIGNDNAEGDGRPVSSATSTIARSSSARRSGTKKAVHAAERLSRDPSNADLVAFAISLHNTRKLLEADGVTSLRASDRCSSLRRTAVGVHMSPLLRPAGGSYHQLAERDTSSSCLTQQRLASFARSSALSRTPAASSDGAAAATLALEAATEMPSPRMQPSAPPRPSGPPPPIPLTVPPPTKSGSSGIVDDPRSGVVRPKQAPSSKPLPPPKPSKLTLAVAQS